MIKVDKSVFSRMNTMTVIFWLSLSLGLNNLRLNFVSSHKCLGSPSAALYSDDLNVVLCFYSDYWSADVGVKAPGESLLSRLSCP